MPESLEAPTLLRTTARPVKAGQQNPSSLQRIRVAIACSGLGHVQRGVEAWAEDLAAGLRRRAPSLQLDLFAATSGPDRQRVQCLKRNDLLTRRVASVLRQLGGWRYGMGSPYEVEQTSFALGLWRRIHRSHDLLHVQDPVIARFFEAAHRAGLSRPKVILAHGTSEAPSTLRAFSTLQHLIPEAADEWEAHRPSKQASFVIPNLIDVTRFHPAASCSVRARLGLPQDKLIVLCCAAIRRRHKRIDYLLNEFAAANTAVGGQMMLIIAGAQEEDTADLIQMGHTLLGDAVRFMVNVPRAEVKDLYQAADVFVLPSLQEMFGIVLLEAMSSGLPVVCHDSPSFRAVVGDGGVYSDLSKDGGLQASLPMLLDAARRRNLAMRGRDHVQACFSEAAVVPQVLSMYETVSGKAI
ncbi:glycosyltransferase [Roseomonas nepalensis]|uniref:Glycosyltransferase n=1 Tax=Muricoccus nepalensis TaxID=1854500 RepID=A0A502FK09_9PROT|nr:glycosyltransferase family 4 protein [Roseomonas nepalensis]TPG49582.1 glycosyltransferase [Roseomonas nepalensis]